MTIARLYTMLTDLDELSKKCGSVADHDGEYLTAEELKRVGSYLEQYSKTLRNMEFMM